MKLGRHLLARLWACALCCLAFAANGATDTSFLLTATSSDFDRYFPTYLANGYLVTGPRGTESDLAYLAAFMDYTQEDIARPAAIPGWSGVDYSTGKSSAGEFWFNGRKARSEGLQGLSPDTEQA